MKKLSAIRALALGVTVALGGVAAATPPAPTIAQFLSVRTPSGVSIAPDGTVYFRDWPDGVNQLYKRAKGAPIDGPAERLTDYKDGLSSYSLSPDGKCITLAAAVGGNEDTNIWLLNTATDAVQPILQNPAVQFRVNAWLHDSSGFLYTANDESPNDFHIYRFDIASGKSTKLLAREGSWSASDITKDGARALVARYLSISDSRIYELNTATGELTDLSATEEANPSSNSIVGYMPGETAIMFESDFRDGLLRLFVRDAAAGSAIREALPALAAYEIDGASINHERTFLATAHNEDGYARMRVFQLPALTEIAMPAIEEGMVFPAEMRGNLIAWTVTNARTPGITYATEIAADGRKAGAPRAITARVDKEPVDLSTFRLPELVKYTSFDGLEIPAFLYLPANYQKGTPIPFVVNFHGGPEGQSRPGFDRTAQYLVSRGYGVLLPNVRGSTGYGRDFHMMDNYTKRWDSVKDGAEAARWLVKEGYAEPKKIAAYGGSYGGFMSVATVIEGADVFGASINVVGITNMKTFLEQTRGYRRALREVEYGPLSDPEFLNTVSPIHRADEIQCPMMIAHGLNDPRVPVGEAMQLAVALQKRGLDPEQLYFADEGHGFAKLDNRILFNERMVKFLDEHIGGASR